MVRGDDGGTEQRGSLQRARLKVERYPDSLIPMWLLIIIVQIKCELLDTIYLFQQSRQQDVQ